jgi:nucleoside 2-deoxyribosyltransferase
MRIFLICSVRSATPERLAEQEAYVRKLESSGHIVHYPPRDTNQHASGIDICRQNREAIRNADEVHVFYSPDSQGTHFDMGMAFALGKPVVVARNVPYGSGKSYPRMLDEWQESGS